MELFERVENDKYSWTLYYYLQNAIYNWADGTHKVIRTEIEDGTVIEREVVSGVGLNISDWNKKFDLCKKLQVFTSELELSLLCPDREINLYSAKGSKLDIQDIDVVGSYIYISDKEICTPVVLKDNNAYADNSYFLNFKEYVFSNHTETDNLTFDFNEETKTFVILLDDENGKREIYRMIGNRKSLTYAFVFFALKNLPRSGKEIMQKGFNIEKIKRRRYDDTRKN